MTPSLLSEHDLLVLDLDGVVYVGPDAVPGAVEALTAASQAGVVLRYVTNNASRTPAEVAAHLRRLGVPARDSEVVAASQAAARLVAEKTGPGAAVLAVGGPGVAAALRAEGLTVVTSADDRPEAVVQGYGPDVGWPQLTEAALAVRGGALWVATNLDATLPTPRGPAPGNGSLVAAVRTATGAEPLVAGKPEPALFRLAAAGARSPLVIGDRLDTDVAAARRAGMRSLLVLTGVTGPDELLRAAPDERPDLVCVDLRGLRQPPAVAQRVAGAWECGGSRAEVVDGTLHVGGDGDPVDALRAAAAAAWDAADSGRSWTATPDLLARLRTVVGPRR